ncbi:MAG: ArsA family ATPase [Deltaproteobacteria bacterium]|nr:ArsA family ATPase [Deltaproteobacteria bacterium]
MEYRDIRDTIRTDEADPMVIVCCGSGGVGKTTISAALGLSCAMSGHKTLVLTVDPARRLADALGVSPLSHEPQRVNTGKTPELSGELYAMMLDPQYTFDMLIKRYAPNGLKDHILNNRYYMHISRNMAGSHEYMAMEKLYEVFTGGGYDRIVLDTPPSRRALDFLEAPQRVLDLLGHRYFLKLFQPYIKAGQWSSRIFNFLATPVLKAVGQVVGHNALTDLLAFFQLWNDLLFDGFRRRASAVKSLLSSPSTIFFAVTTPQAFPRTEAVGLAHKLVERKFSFAGFIVNRVHEFKNHDSLEKDPPQFQPGELGEKISIAYRLEQRLARSDAHALKALETEAGPAGVIHTIPFSDESIHDLSGLIEVCRHLMRLPVNGSRFKTEE